MKTFEQIQREQNMLRFAKSRGSYVTVLTLAEQTEQREREQKEREQVQRRAKQRAEQAEREQVQLAKYRAERAEREQREREQKAQELVSLGKLSLSIPSYMEDVLDEYWTEYMETANRERDRERREKAIAKRIVQRIMNRAEREQAEQAEQSGETTNATETAKQDSEQAKQAERKRAEILSAWRAEREQVQKARQSDSDRVEQAERTARQNREREQAERDSVEQAKKDGSLITVNPEQKKPIFPYLKQTAKQTRLRYRERTESDTLRNMDSEQAEKLVHTAKVITHQSVKTLYAKNDKAQESVLNMLYIDSTKLLKTDKQAWTRFCTEQAEQSGETTNATETIIHDRQRVTVSDNKSFMVECVPWTEQKETEYNKQVTTGYNETAYTAEDIMQTVLLRMTELFQIGQFTTDSDIWTAIRKRKMTAETEQQAEQKATAKKLVNLIYSSANTFVKGQKTRAEREQRDSTTDSDSEQDSNTRVYEIDAQDGKQTDGYTLNNYKALNDSIIHSGLTEIIKKLYSRVKSPETCARVIMMHGDSMNNLEIARALSLDEKQVRRFITYGERIANSKEALELVYELTIAL